MNKTTNEVKVDRYGLRYVTDPETGWDFYITDCCDASAKGSVAGDYPAVVCRACYTEVDPALGGIPEPVR